MVNVLYVSMLTKAAIKAIFKQRLQMLYFAKVKKVCM